MALVASQTLLAAEHRHSQSQTEKMKEGVDFKANMLSTQGLMEQREQSHSEDTIRCLLISSPGCCQGIIMALTS